MPASRLQNYTITYNNSEEYHHLKREIFTGDLYYFETDSPAPFIIDAGAHIGLATLYFKQLYPGAEIIALEPNLESFQLLETNLFENQIDGVTAIQAALSESTGPVSFYKDATPEKWHSTAGLHKGSWVGSQESEESQVQAHTLQEFITKEVDFLKLDIEGVEQKVLTSAQESLPLIKELHIEFHPHPTQSLKKLVELLELTHAVELYNGTRLVSVKKASGLTQIRAIRRK